METESTGPNKKLIIIIVVVLSFFLIGLLILIALLKRGSSTSSAGASVTPTGEVPTITAIPGSEKRPPSNSKNASSAADIKIQPTLLTPVPLPKTVGQLKEDLVTTMKYKDISIRYSKGRDVFIIYYSSTIFAAQNTFSELISQYGVADVGTVNTEYINNKAPIPERPPKGN
jgi:hypothetical protein